MNRVWKGLHQSEMNFWVQVVACSQLTQLNARSEVKACCMKITCTMERVVMALLALWTLFKAILFRIFISQTAYYKYRTSFK